MQQHINREGTGIRQQVTGAGWRETPAGLSRYELKASLPRFLSAQIEAEQSFALQTFGREDFSPSQPGLLVAAFYAHEEMESTLLRWLNRVIGQQESFPVLFNNYSSMPGYPIYLRVQDPAPFRNLAENLRVIDAWLKGNDCPALTLFHHPRLSLVDSLGSAKAMEILLEFSGRCFRADMELEELELTCRPAGEEVSRVVCRFKLLPRGLRAGRED